MSKVVTSPIKRFPGTVTLADPLTFPQFDAWSNAIESATDYLKSQNGTSTQSGYDQHLLPGLYACVEKFDLQGLAADNIIPATPRKSSAQLIAWLVREIGALAAEAEDIPNA